MKFSQLAIYFEQIEQTSSRTEMTKLLGDLFKKLTPIEYQQSVYLLQGLVAPKYAGINFGMAEKMAARAAISAFQVDAKQFMTELGRVGDIGKVTEDLKKEHPSLEAKDLTIDQVFTVLVAITKAAGEGSQDEKSRLLGSLIRQLDPLSTRYIVRIPLGQLRLGFSDMTILDALSWMETGDKSLRPALQGAYHVRPDLGHVGCVLKEKGIEAVHKIQPHIFTPILMMRAERLSSGDEIIDQIGECFVEPKFDGFRLQIHKKGDEVRLYTRGLEDTTFMYPDIVEGVKKEIKVTEIIFEGEAIGYDPDTATFLPFQETVQRKRKYGIEEKALEIPLKLFSFDLLYCEGASFISKPFIERRKELERVVHKDNNAAKHTILLAQDQLLKDGKAIELMFDDAITKGLEGIVAKKIDGKYEPGARGWNWIKFKRSYSSKINDTVDCLVMGYDLGKGKRAAFGIGAFLVGIYDDKKDMYLTMAKIGTGLTDDEWRDLKKRGDKLKVKEKPALYDVDKMMECDVWITPEIVVEIKADEITRSTIHTAGRVLKSNKSGNGFEIETAGYAFRFPRLQRFRDDKSPGEVTTLKEIQKIGKK